MECVLCEQENKGFLMKTKQKNKKQHTCGAINVEFHSQTRQSCKEGKKTSLMFPVHVRPSFIQIGYSCDDLNKFIDRSCIFYMSLLWLVLLYDPRKSTKPYSD